MGDAAERQSKTSPKRGSVGEAEASDDLQGDLREEVAAKTVDLLGEAWLCEGEERGPGGGGREGPRPGFKD